MKHLFRKDEPGYLIFILKTERGKHVNKPQCDKKMTTGNCKMKIKNLSNKQITIE